MSDRRSFLEQAEAELARDRALQRVGLAGTRLVNKLIPSLNRFGVALKDVGKALAELADALADDDDENDT